MNKISEHMKRELERLALLREDEINTLDLPEETNWSGGQRSRFTAASQQNRNYDIRSIANWFLDALKLRDRPVTNLSLNKLVYFAIERFLIEENVLLSPAKIEAWSHGPVFREIYHALKDNEDREITRKIQKFSISDRKFIVAHDDFITGDLHLMESIADTYGKLSAGQLVSLSHRNGEPWASVWHYEGRSNPGMEISIDTILQRAPKKRVFNG